MRKRVLPVPSNPATPKIRLAGIHTSHVQGVARDEAADIGHGRESGRLDLRGRSQGVNIGQGLDQLVTIGPGGQHRLPGGRAGLLAQSGQVLAHRLPGLGQGIQFPVQV